MIPVLVADDFEVIMKSIRLLIDSFEDVEIMAEEERFGEVLESRRDENQDVILLNDYVPPLDSAVTTRRLREMGIETPILVMSAHGNGQHIETTMAAGANGYIRKEEFLEELYTAIRIVDRGETYLSPRAVAALEEKAEQ